VRADDPRPEGGAGRAGPGADEEKIMAMPSRLLSTLCALVLAAAAGQARAQSDDGPAPPPAAPAPLRGAPSAPAPASPGIHGTQTRDLGFLIHMNFDFGGDVVQDVTWTNGDSTKLKAGQLITFAAGALYHPAAPWALEATLGYKFDKANGSNGTIEFTRIPLDVIASWAIGGSRLGAGPTLHFSPTFNCDASGVCSTQSTYDTAVGGIIQYAYGFAVNNHGYDLGLRYTFIHYSSGGATTLDGSGFGFFFGGWL
jgi:hypothetical protein